MSKKLTLVVGINPDKYEIDDHRLRKPVWHQKHKNGQIVGSGLFQELDQIKIVPNEVIYFQPNNIALLLSISKKQLTNAISFFNENFKNVSSFDYIQFNGNKKKFIGETSKLICDYIEFIETSIVFSYTAVEAFANISIPEHFKYAYKNKSKNFEGNYDKNEIERWIPLTEKITKILPEIFKVKKPTRKNWWGDFIKLENLRHNIIHQKSIDSTEFYKEYFKKEIFRVCQSAEILIQYFYDETAKQNKTHIMWPWLRKTKSEFPISFEFDESKIEIVGNLYEGIKKKSL
ncbi:MAG: hypothetical protein WAU11_14865 [Ignavibacteriaceae bacterium]